MDLEKTYDTVDREAVWKVMVLKEGFRMLGVIKAFYREASTSVTVDGELSESFPLGVGVREGCVMSPWLFNIFSWISR